jgi:hypothetical protein
MDCHLDRLTYVEQELAKRQGKDLGIKTEEIKPIEDDLYVIPEHLKVRLCIFLGRLTFQSHWTDGAFKFLITYQMS